MCKTLSPAATVCMGKPDISKKRINFASGRGVLYPDS